MRTADPASIVSRYACLDFAELPGFPNHLPSDEYLLSNGPKFNGEDLRLAVDHITNFRDFAELLRVKHEDVFIRLFYDSLQGKCKSWVENLPVGSIRSLPSFWLIFLKRWMGNTKSRADSLSIKDFKEWSDMYTDEEQEERFSSILSYYLKSTSCNSESKVIFLKEFAAHIEKEIEAVEVKIQDLSFQSPFQLSFDIRIENKDGFDNPKLRKWYDPVAEYIKEFIESRFQYTFYDKSENQNFRQLMIVVPVFILLIHRSRLSLSIQILVWLHWKHDFT